MVNMNNLSEEEKKAVEFVKKRTKELKKYAKRENELVYDDIILNLINKLQKENEKLQKETEELKKDYYNVINKIENKIDRFDYKFEKAKRQNNKDKSDYYWNLIINFKELLESEE